MVNLKIKNESNNELPSYGSKHASGANSHFDVLGGGGKKRLPLLMWQ